MKNPLISVIVPVYNIERFVGKCLKSLTAQSYESIEIIVVDDGSVDGSGQICDEMARQDKRIKVFHKKNGGLSDARNFGIKRARGEIVALVDGDDYVEPYYVETMVDVMLANDDVDVVVCGFNGEKLKKTIMSGKNATAKLLTEQENIEIVAWNKLYKKRLFIDNDIWYPVREKNEDNLTTYKLLAAARKVAYIDRTLYHYVEREGSIMDTTNTEERLAMRERAAREAIEYFQDDAGLRRAAEVALLLAKYAFMDAAIRGEVASGCFDDGVKWVRNHKKDYKGNQYLTWKLRLYNILSMMGLYRIFRTII